MIYSNQFHLLQPASKNQPRPEFKASTPINVEKQQERQNKENNFMIVLSGDEKENSRSSNAQQMEIFKEEKKETYGWSEHVWSFVISFTQTT
jgi:hypothetical protein